MKKAIALLLVLTLTAALFGCGEEELHAPGAFYYYRNETAFFGPDGVLAPETRELAGIEEDLDAILALYCQGPRSRDLESPIPKGCPAPAYTLADGVLTLSFAAEFADLSGIELTVAAGCLARTFLGLTDAHTLVLTADGALLDGESAMTVTLQDLGLEDDSRDRLHGDYTVYFTGVDRRYLLPHTVHVDLTTPEELPKLLLEQMCLVPEDLSVYSVFPDGTRILSVRVEDGQCIVDLSREFENRRFYSHSGQLLSLMGVVNTLTSLPEIERVEFTVEGELLIRYGSITLSGPLVRDDRFLGPVRTSLGEWDATVYLAHEGETSLVSLPLRLRQSAAVSQAELMLRALLADPGTNGVGTCISEGTRLNSVRLENHICLVDLSGEFLEEPDTLTLAARVITASLCTLDGIGAVRITVDGGVPADVDPGIFGVLTPQSDWFL